jgi:hypothetical protein
MFGSTTFTPKFLVRGVGVKYSKCFSKLTSLMMLECAYKNKSIDVTL